MPGQTDPAISSLFDFTAGDFNLLGDQFVPRPLNTERRHIDDGVVEGDGLFTAPVLATFAHQQTLDREGLLGRATSASCQATARSYSTRPGHPTSSSTPAASLTC